MTRRTMNPARAFAALGIALVAAFGIAGWRMGWADLWANPDQRGRYLFDQGRYGEAAQAFRDPMWRGVAQMRAGDFKAAEATFAGIDTAEGAYDQGNALIMLGKYPEAVARYDHALALRPGWPEARANRQIAKLRAERLDAPGEDAGDQREGADQIVYDKDARRPGGQETEVSGPQAMNDEAVRALWLKRVETKPADFLRARFGYQLEAQQQAAGQEERRP
jgi:Ca-activated chloride channel homolog